VGRDGGLAVPPQVGDYWPAAAAGFVPGAASVSGQGGFRGGVAGVGDELTVEYGGDEEGFCQGVRAWP
jgi:hypothetical protein